MRIYLLLRDRCRWLFRLQDWFRHRKGFHITSTGEAFK